MFLIPLRERWQPNELLHDYYRLPPFNSLPTLLHFFASSRLIKAYLCASFFLSGADVQLLNFTSFSHKVGARERFDGIALLEVGLGGSGAVAALLG